MVEAWIEVSGTYKCVECGEKMVSLLISYGEPVTYEIPLFCPVHWKKNLKSAVKTIVRHPDIGEDEKTRLIARLLDFIEAR